MGDGAGDVCDGVGAYCRDGFHSQSPEDVGSGSFLLHLENLPSRSLVLEPAVAPYCL